MQIGIQSTLVPLIQNVIGNFLNMISCAKMRFDNWRKKLSFLGQNGDSETTIMGVAFAVNDSLSISYGEQETEIDGQSLDQELEGFSVEFAHSWIPALDTAGVLSSSGFAVDVLKCLREIKLSSLLEFFKHRLSFQKRIRLPYYLLALHFNTSNGLLKETGKGNLFNWYKVLPVQVCRISGAFARFFKDVSWHILRTWIDSTLDNRNTWVILSKASDEL